MFLPSSNFSYFPEDSNNYYFFYDLLSCPEEGESAVIQECFSTLYKSGAFLESIHNVLVEYDSAGVEGCWWYYPDLSSPYPDDVFEGVCFEIGFDNPDMKVYVPEKVSFNYAKKACERFLEIHPEYKGFLTEIIDNWKPLKP